MAASSCQFCIFSQWKDQSQIGCLFGRTEKYPSIDVLNGEMNGTFKVLTQNICTAKRGKDFLQKHPRDPDKVVRQELYPKVQLFLIIHDLTSEWIDFFANTDLSKYTAVDICLFEPEMEYIRSVGYLLNYKNIFIHACGGERNWTINHFVRNDCQYYVIFTDPNEYKISDLPDKLDKYINDQCKALVMIRPVADIVYGPGDNGLLVSTCMHNYVGGYGSQTVEEKIYIDCENRGEATMIVTMKEFENAITNP